MNRWILTDSVKEKYTPIVTEFIDKVESSNQEISTELLEIDFSDTELRPYTLWKILESLGYNDHYHENLYVQMLRNLILIQPIIHTFYNTR